MKAWSPDGRYCVEVETPNNLVGAWKEGDDQDLIDAVAHGLTHTEIAFHLGRSVEEVRERMKELKNG